MAQILKIRASALKRQFNNWGRALRNSVRIFHHANVATAYQIKRKASQVTRRRR